MTLSDVARAQMQAEIDDLRRYLESSPEQSGSFVVALGRLQATDRIARLKREMADLP